MQLCNSDDLGLWQVTALAVINQSISHAKHHKQCAESFISLPLKSNKKQTTPINKSKPDQTQHHSRDTRANMPPSVTSDSDQSDTSGTRTRGQQEKTQRVEPPPQHTDNSSRTECSLGQVRPLGGQGNGSMAYDEPTMA